MGHEYLGHFTRMGRREMSRQVVVLGLGDFWDFPRRRGGWQSYFRKKAEEGFRAGRNRGKHRAGVWRVQVRMQGLACLQG